MVSTTATTEARRVVTAQECVRVRELRGAFARKGWQSVSFIFDSCCSNWIRAVCQNNICWPLTFVVRKLHVKLWFHNKSIICVTDRRVGFVGCDPDPRSWTWSRTGQRCCQTDTRAHTLMMPMSLLLLKTQKTKFYRIYSFQILSFRTRRAGIVATRPSTMKRRAAGVTRTAMPPTAAAMTSLTSAKSQVRRLFLHSDVWFRRCSHIWPYAWAVTEKDLH